MARRWLVVAALGAATSLTTGEIRAQDPVVRRDSTTDSTTAAARRDSIARAETERLRLARIRALTDTVKSPIARAEVPALHAIGEAPAWDRNRLFASGALTLGELIDRLPGVTTYRAGWISAPEMVAILGRFGRVRIFLDGVELDALSSRLNGQHDMSLIDLWQLDDATVEMGAEEVRVHLRSWSVRNTTPVTRIDITTGDLQTNVYRGFYGRRFPGGQVVQMGGNHYSVNDRRTAEAGDQTSLWARLGMARGRWTVDGTVLRSGRQFTVREEDPNPSDSIPTMDGIATVAIGRVAWGDPGSGPWFQALLSSQSFSIRNPSSTVIDSIDGPGGGGPGGSLANPDTIEVSNDTTRSRPQFVLTGGMSRGLLRLSGAGRIRRWRGETSISPSVRAQFESGPLMLSMFGERSPLDSLQRLEASGSFRLGGRAMLSGAVSRFSPIEGVDAPSSMAVRAELGLRAGRMWVTGGSVYRDTTFLPAAIALDSTFRGAPQGSLTGFFATVRGKFYRDVGVDLSGMRYANQGVYRPQYETRARLYVDSDMRAKFPSGNLNILLAFTHDYRSQAFFPTATGVLESSQYRTWGAELEIKLLSATIMFQYRNFLGAEYAQVPGYTMPSVTSVYGIRWSFIN